MGQNRRTGRSGLTEHRFGGQHTDEKLARLHEYLQAFATALKNQGFVLVYVDAFAGSGVRTAELPALPLLGGDDAAPQIIFRPWLGAAGDGSHPAIRSSHSHRKAP